MKTKFTNGRSLPIGKDSNDQRGSCISFSGILKSVLVLFVLFVYFNANAQTSAPNVKGHLKGFAPAANMRGPLKAYVNGENVVITSEIGTELVPVTSYTLENNTSGASIVSKGSFQYDNSTGIGRETVVINPGSAKGSFTVKLIATTPGGTCKSSKSVSVVNAPASVNGSSINVH